MSVLGREQEKSYEKQQKGKGTEGKLGKKWDTEQKQKVGRKSCSDLNLGKFLHYTLLTKIWRTSVSYIHAPSMIAFLCKT